MQRFVLPTILLVLFSTLVGAGSGAAPPALRTLNGSGNNVSHPTWARQARSILELRLRITRTESGASLAVRRHGTSPIGSSTMSARTSSPRTTSRSGVGPGGSSSTTTSACGTKRRQKRRTMAFDEQDPARGLQQRLGRSSLLPDSRGPGTGSRSPRQQINTLSSFIDASNVYGVTTARLDWLRDGPANGNPTDNAATLLTAPGGYLPRATARGNAAAAPSMDLMGALAATPEKAVVAGDVRANENVALTSIHTLFLREHNRIVASLARTRLSNEEKFQIAGASSARRSSTSRTTSSSRTSACSWLPTGATPRA